MYSILDQFDELRLKKAKIVFYTWLVWWAQAKAAKSLLKQSFYSRTQLNEYHFLLDQYWGNLPLNTFPKNPSRKPTIQNMTRLHDDHHFHIPEKTCFWGFLKCHVKCHGCFCWLVQDSKDMHVGSVDFTAVNYECIQ